MKPYYEEMQDLLCLYENQDVVMYVMKDGESKLFKGNHSSSNAKNINLSEELKPRDLIQCFAKRNIPTKYMECMLNSNIYYYWNEQMVPGKPPMRVEYVQSANGTLSTYECNVRY